MVFLTVLLDISYFNKCPIFQEKLKKEIQTLFIFYIDIATQTPSSKCHSFVKCFLQNPKHKHALFFYELLGSLTNLMRKGNVSDHYKFLRDTRDLQILLQVTLSCTQTKR